MKDKNEDAAKRSRMWITLEMSLGVLLLLIGLVELVLAPAAISENVAIPLVSIGFILVLFAGARYYRGDTTYPQDERTKKIGAYGLSLSWFLTFIVLFVVFWLGFLGLAFFDVTALAVFLILLMGVSARGFQWWFFRQGDIE
jgi:hypothetical protein